MADAAPSTPFTARSNGEPSSSGGRGAAGGRHLKRLSLSHASAFTSPSSPSTSSPLGAVVASPSTPSGSRVGGAEHGKRGTRLSLSGSLPPSFAASTQSTPSTPIDDRAALGTSPTMLRRSASARSSTLPPLAPGTPPLSGVEPSPLSVSIGRRSGGHARRTSSISYAPRSSMDGVTSGLGLMTEEGGMGVGDGGAGGENMSRRSSVRLLKVGEEPEKENFDVRREGSNPLAMSMPGRGPLAPIGTPTQATLVEQHADLLSFLAKKERKCLDLREELKRHESELATLKKKWESIVARSLREQHQAPPASSSSPAHYRASSISTSSSASPHPSPSPLHSSTLSSASHSHSLDLGLLSSTFDPSDFDTLSASGGLDTPPLEIPESVKAAGSWLGSQLGKVLDAAVGFPPTAENGEERERQSGGLERLVEESEGEEEEEEQDESALTEEQRSRRRESKGSSVSVASTADTTTSFGAGSRSTAPSSVASEETVSPLTHSSPAFESPTHVHKHTFSSASTPSASNPLRERALPSSAPPAPSSSSRHSAFSPPSSSSSASQASPSPSSRAPPPSTPSHARRSSTALDALSGGWTSINKRWTALSESEVVQTSKRATLGLVDTFEQGLAQALGPLEPPQLGEIAGGRDGRESEVQSPTRRAQGRRGSRDEIPSPFLAAAGQQQQQQQRDSLPSFGAPGQGLSSLFSSLASSTSTAPQPTSSSSSAAAPPARRDSADGGWDWSAFLPASMSTESGLDEQGSPTKMRNGSGKAKERAAPVDDGGEEWPIW